MVYRRTINGQTVAFGHQGATWDGVMALFDHATGSVWAQHYGRAILGELTNTELELIQYTLTTWGDWIELNPSSLAYVAEADSDENATLEDMAIVVNHVDDSAGYPVPALREVGVVNDTVGEDLPIAIVIVDETWRVFSRKLSDGTLLELEIGEGFELVDATTGSAFDMRHGGGLSGKFADRRLELLPSSTIFAEDYARYYPEGKLWNVG